MPTTVMQYFFPRKTRLQIVHEVMTEVSRSIYDDVNNRVINVVKFKIFFFVLVHSVSQFFPVNEDSYGSNVHACVDVKHPLLHAFNRKSLCSYLSQTSAYQEMKEVE